MNDILARYVPFYNGDGKDLFFTMVKKHFPLKYRLIIDIHDEVEEVFDRSGIIRLSGESYSAHLRRTAMINVDVRLRSRGRYGLDYLDVIFAIHHETLEDLKGLNGYSLIFFKKTFGEKFTTDLLSVSNTEVDGIIFRTKEMADKDSYRRVANAGLRPQIFKPCDRLDFFLDCHSVSKEAIADKARKTRQYLMEIAWKLNILPRELEMAMLIAEGGVVPISNAT